MIREATIQDVVKCADLAEAFFYQRNCMGDLSKDAFVDFWKRAIFSDIGVILMRETDGTPKEAVGYIEHPGFNGKPCVSTMFWYVTDDSQGLATGSLLDAFLERVKGISEIRVALLVDETLTKVSSTLQGCGFSLNEMVYMKENK